VQPEASKSTPNAKIQGVPLENLLHLPFAQGQGHLSQQGTPCLEVPRGTDFAKELWLWHLPSMKIDCPGTGAANEDDN
jgi:hypothetical protein